MAGTVWPVVHDWPHWHLLVFLQTVLQVARFNHQDLEQSVCLSLCQFVRNKYDRLGKNPHTIHDGR
jgi:hypothetical protein